MYTSMGSWIPILFNYNVANIWKLNFSLEMIVDSYAVVRIIWRDSSVLHPVSPNGSILPNHSLKYKQVIDIDTMYRVVLLAQRSLLLHFDSHSPFPHPHPGWTLICSAILQIHFNFFILKLLKLLYHNSCKLGLMLPQRLCVCVSWILWW